MMNRVRMFAMVGNILLVLWVTYNGIDEGFRGTPAEKVSYVFLIGLLVANTVLLWRSRRQRT